MVFVMLLALELHRITRSLYDDHDEATHDNLAAVSEFASTRDTVAPHHEPAEFEKCFARETFWSFCLSKNGRF